MQASAVGAQEQQLKQQLAEARNQVSGLEAQLVQVQELQQEVARLQQVISTGSTQLQQAQQQELAAKQEAGRLASEVRWGLRVIQKSNTDTWVHDRRWPRFLSVPRCYIVLNILNPRNQSMAFDLGGQPQASTMKHAWFPF
jgi:septal ring factor EnvC (AmiA/AmiB activator)